LLFAKTIIFIFIFLGTRVSEHGGGQLCLHGHVYAFSAGDLAMMPNQVLYCLLAVVLALVDAIKKANYYYAEIV
jgi:hypothetical protein